MRHTVIIRKAGLNRCFGLDAQGFVLAKTECVTDFRDKTEVDTVYSAEVGGSSKS